MKKGDYALSITGETRPTKCEEIAEEIIYQQKIKN